MTNTDGTTSASRQTPRLLFAIEPEQNFSVRIEADTFEDEQRVRLWARSADMARLVSEALEVLDDRWVA